MYGTQQPQAAVTNNRERKVLTMANQIFMRVNEVAEELGVSIPYAYKLIRQLNEELAKTGCITISGRIDRKFFHEKFYSYSSDYDVIGKLKQFADKHGVCVLIVHHTRKQPAGDSFEMISGTTGLLGCADGALLMQKEKRTDGKATLDIVGRDQPDQRLYLTKDQEHLVWELERAENELWKQPPDPVLEAVSKMVSAENPDWEGSPTELAETLQTDMAVNRLTKHLNVNASRLLEEHHLKYENKTKHAGRRIRLTYMVVEQTAVAVTE